MAEDFSGSPEKPLKRRGTEEAEDRESPDNHETQVIENGFLPQGEKQTLPRMNADLEARITAEARRNLHSINIEVMWSRTTAIFRLSFVMKSVAAASLFLLVHCLVAQQSPAGR